MRRYTNPTSFAGRFAAHALLGLSAMAVAMLVFWAVRGVDPWFAVLFSLGFAVLFGLARAALATPGTPFWGPLSTEPPRADNAAQPGSPTDS